MVFVLSTAATAFAPLVYVGYVVGTELAPYVLASVAIHGTAAVAGLYYYLKPKSSNSHIAANSDVIREAEVQYIDLSAPVPMLNLKPVKAKIPIESVKTFAASNPTKYPNLSAALNPISNTIMVNDSPVSVGVYLGSFSENYDCFPGYSTSTTTYQGAPALSVKTWADGSYTYTYYSIPVTAPTTPATKLQALTGSTDGGNLSSNYQDEIDNMLQDPSYVPSFSDGSTGLPYVAPPSYQVATPEQVASYNATGGTVPAAIAAGASAGSSATSAAAATQAAAAANTAAQAAAASATSAAAIAAVAASNSTAANAANVSAQAAAAASGTSANIAAAQAAQGRADVAAGYAALTAGQASIAASDAAAAGSAAAGAASQAAAAAAAADVESKTKASVAAGIPARPDKKTIDFEPFKELNGMLANTYPFNLPSSIASYYHALVGTGAAPVFDLPLFGNTIHVDMAFFNPIATMIRYMVGLLVSSGMLFYIIHFIRGIS